MSTVRPIFKKGIRRSRIQLSTERTLTEARLANCRFLSSSGSMFRVGPLSGTMWSPIQLTLAAGQRVIGCVNSLSRDYRRSGAAAGDSVRVSGHSTTEKQTEIRVEQCFIFGRISFPVRDVLEGREVY